MALSGLPVRPGWDFGGYPYGLEPLVLPAVGDADATGGDPAEPVVTQGYAEVCWRLRGLAERGVLTPEVERCEPRERVYWFRWITGHQVCFIVWRLMAQLLAEVREGRRPAQEAIGPLSHYVHGYSAMLLYTGSYSSAVYEDMIRPSLRRRHPAFSGSWAPDYWPLRDLFRGRLATSLEARDASDLVEALRVNHLVHDGIAAKLVPDGKSLLRQAAVRGISHRLVAMIYDSYFVTVRAPATRHEVVTQLLRRLVAIGQELAVNGLHGDDDRGGRPAELRTPEVLRCEERFGHILSDVARCACELAAVDVATADTEPLQPAARAPRPR